MFESLMQLHFKSTLGQRFLGAALLISLFIAGCTHSSDRFHTQFPNFRLPMRAMLVLPPEIRIFERFQNGSQLLQDRQSEEAQRNVQASIVEQLEKHRFTVRLVDEKAIQKADYQSITSLFRSVNRSIQLHTYGPQIYPIKLNAFDYSVGSIADILQAYGADGLVMAIGYQSGARQPDKSWLSIAVVEPGGRIIWYGLQDNPQQIDLQREEDLSALVAETMMNFWGNRS